MEKNFEFTYKMLGRLKSDCEYFLGAGNRAEKYLWANSVTEQISEMKRLFHSLPEDQKPEWLTLEQISNYENKMKGE